MSRRAMLTVDQWQRKFPIDNVHNLSALGYAFGDALAVQVPTLFEHIYIPMRVFDNTTKLMTDEIVALDIGFSPSEIATIYWSQYKANLLVTDLRKFSYNGQILWLQAATDLALNIKGQVYKNLGKYKKMIELMGYSYNPLFNVDGTEITTVIDNHGGILRQNSPVIQDSVTHNVSSYDGDSKEEYSDDIDYVRDVEVNTESHQMARNLYYNSIINPSTEQPYGWEERPYVAEAKDTAYGQKIIGGDYFHTDKHIRQGNIGVTKTTELIEAERENLRWNILQEFFNDINPYILVGVFPEF